MDIISLSSLFIILITVLLYYLMPVKYRFFLLILISMLAYTYIAGIGMTIVQYSVIILSFVLGRKMISYQEEKSRKLWFYISTTVSILPLLFFKYLYDFLPLGAIESSSLSFIIVPLGVSYYTFMILGTLIDLYYEDIEDLPKFKYYLTFIGFFPLTLSGPIERTDNFLGQLIEMPKFNSNNFKIGLQLILWGCFFKLVMADRICLYVDAIYNNLDKHNGPTIMFSSLLYPFQVYGDLGGYTLMVRGVSKLFGFDIIRNFNRPFMAQTVADFWRRWHMSLINWLRDYIFIPLSFYFRSMGKTGSIIALVITFLLSGVWHEAELKYLLWGAFHALLLALELIFLKTSFGESTIKNKNRRLLKFVSSATIVYILFSISQVFVRVDNLSSLKIIGTNLFNFGSLYLDKTTLAYSFFGIIIVFSRDILNEFKKIPAWAYKDSFLVLEFSFLVISILLFGIIDNSNFIYFQF